MNSVCERHGSCIDRPQTWMMRPSKELAFEVIDVPCRSAVEDEKLESDGSHVHIIWIH